MKTINTKTGTLLFSIALLAGSCGVNSTKILSQHELKPETENVKYEKVKAGHRTFYSEIIIDATPEQVWSVLTDFKNYSWSNTIKELTGDFKDGGTVNVVYYNDYEKEKTTTYTHVLKVIDGQEFSWSDPFAGGMVDNHIYRIEDAGNGKTKFIQIDGCKGGATWRMGSAVSKYQLTNYPKFNRRLKAEVEKRY